MDLNRVLSGEPCFLVFNHWSSHLPFHLGDIGFCHSRIRVLWTLLMWRAPPVDYWKRCLKNITLNCESGQKIIMLVKFNWLTRHVFVKCECPQWQQISKYGKIFKSHILTLPQPLGACDVSEVWGTHIWTYSSSLVTVITAQTLNIALCL